MSNLRTYWEEYRRIEQKGERTARCFELEKLIHEEQKKMGVSRYDFNARWLRIEQQAESSISGPTLEPTEKEPVPTSNFSFEYAKEKLGENDFAILEECAMNAEIIIVCLAKILDGINSENTRNPARRGQAINFAMRLYEERKNGST